MKKITLSAIFLISILTLSACGKSQENTEVNQITNEIKQESQEVDKVESKEEKKLGELKKVDTSDWKTYKNEEYGFEVKYPKGWSIEEEKDDEDKVFHIKAEEAKYYFEGTPVGAVFRLSVSSDLDAKKNFDNYISNAFDKYDNCYVNKVYINNIEASRYKCFFGNEIVFNKNSNFWQFDDNGGLSDMYKDDLNDTFEGVLQSIKFTK